MAPPFFTYGDPIRAAEAAAEEAESFRVEDYDRRLAPQSGVAETIFGPMQFIDINAGQRLWIYKAILPLDYRSDMATDEEHTYDRRVLMESGSRLAWCASAGYPAGELGMARADPEPIEVVIDKDSYLAAARAGWPALTGGQG